MRSVTMYPPTTFTVASTNAAKPSHLEISPSTCPEAIIYHHGGTASGSGSISRRASAFANYFYYRNRMRFVGRFNWPALPSAYAYSLLKIAKLVLLGAWDEAAGAMRGLHQLPPSATMSARLSPEAAERAFGRRRQT